MGVCRVKILEHDDGNLLMQKGKREGETKISLKLWEVKKRSNDSSGGPTTEKETGVIVGLCYGSYIEGTDLGNLTIDIVAFNFRLKEPNHLSGNTTPRSDTEVGM